MGGIFLMQAARRPQRMPVRRSLTALPQALPGWTGQDLAIEPRILEAIGVNDYVNRVYVSPLESWCSFISAIMARSAAAIRYTPRRIACRALDGNPFARAVFR